MNEIKKLISDLTEQKEKLRAEMDKINDAIVSLQKLCKHEHTKYTGHGHNYDVYECVDCKEILCE